MRALFVAAPHLSHAIPLMPLATAMREGGHDVLLATGGDAVSVRGGGLAVHDLAPGFVLRPVARRIMLRHPLVAQAELRGKGGVRGTALIFGAINELIADGLVDLARTWRPDLVLYEPLAPAGALAAAALGVPAVLHGVGPVDGVEQARVVNGRMAAAYGRYGLDGPPADAAMVTVAPASLVGARPGWPMRHVAYDQGSLPDWLAAREGRPRILVSRSTIGDPGARAVTAGVVRAARRVDADFVLIFPKGRVPDAKRLPGNVRAVGWIPLKAAIDTSSAIVHHGGVGTVLNALAAGVPQLVIPGVADRRYNADVVAARGAGMAMRAGQITAEHLTRLVTDPTIAAAAQQVRDEMARMPPPEQLVERLVALVGSADGTPGATG
jgi:UDP:flavonoid glycosyltransferase YjiC (YdhE family)